MRTKFDIYVFITITGSTVGGGGGLSLSGGIIRPVVSVSSVFLNINVIINKTKVLLPQTSSCDLSRFWLSSLCPFVLLLPKC